MSELSEKETMEIFKGITAEISEERCNSVMILIDIREYDDWIKKGNNIIGFELDNNDLKKLKKFAKKTK